MLSIQKHLIFHIHKVIKLNWEDISGNWAEEEDELLFKTIETYGVSKWEVIEIEFNAKNFFGIKRTAKSCEERYLELTKRKIWKKYKFPEEDLKKLLEAQNIHGNKWNLIKHNFPYRDESYMKNQYNNWLRKSIRKFIRELESQNFFKANNIDKENIHIPSIVKEINRRNIKSSGLNCAIISELILQSDTKEKFDFEISIGNNENSSVFPNVEEESYDIDELSDYSKNDDIKNKEKEMDLKKSKNHEESHNSKVSRDLNRNSISNQITSNIQYENNSINYEINESLNKYTNNINFDFNMIGKINNDSNLSNVNEKVIEYPIYQKNNTEFPNYFIPFHQINSIEGLFLNSNNDIELREKFFQNYQTFDIKSSEINKALKIENSSTESRYNSLLIDYKNLKKDYEEMVKVNKFLKDEYFDLLIKYKNK